MFNSPLLVSLELCLLKVRIAGLHYTSCELLSFGIISWDLASQTEVRSGRLSSLPLINSLERLRPYVVGSSDLASLFIINLFWLEKSVVYTLELILSIDHWGKGCRGIHGGLLCLRGIGHWLMEMLPWIVKGRCLLKSSLALLQILLSIVPSSTLLA